MSFLQSKYAGYIVTPKGASIVVYKTPGATAIKTVSMGQIVGFATGRYTNQGGSSWLEITVGSTQNELQKKVVGYSKSDELYLSKNPFSSSNTDKAKTQQLFNEIVAADAKTYINLINAYALAKEYKKRGVVIPQSIVNQFFTIWQQLQTRQSKIKEDKNLLNQTGVPNADTPAKQQALTDFVTFVQAGSKSIGIIPVIAYVIIAVAIAVSVAATTAVVLYNKYKPDYDRSKANLKQSEELKKLLNDLDPETRQKIVDDLEKQIDDAYAKGKTAGKFSGSMGIIKPVALLLGGYFIFTKFINSQKK